MTEPLTAEQLVEALQELWEEEYNIDSYFEEEQNKLSVNVCSRNMNKEEL